MLAGSAAWVEIRSLCFPQALMKILTKTAVENLVMILVRLRGERMKMSGAISRAMTFVS
jgi:hypothetical protein